MNKTPRFITLSKPYAKSLKAWYYQVRKSSGRISAQDKRRLSEAMAKAFTKNTWSKMMVVYPMIGQSGETEPAPMWNLENPAANRIQLDISTDGGQTWETKDFITSPNSHKMNTEQTGAEQAQDTDPSAGLITEEKAAALLGISERTLKNMVYSGKMPKDAYTVAVTGKRFYFTDKLLGLPNK